MSITITSASASASASASDGAAKEDAKGWNAQQILADRLGRIGKNYPRQKHVAGGVVRIAMPYATYDDGKLHISASVDTSCLTGTVTKKAAKTAAMELLTQVVEDARERIRAAGFPNLAIVVDLDVRVTGTVDSFQMP